MESHNEITTVVLGRKFGRKFWLCAVYTKNKQKDINPITVRKTLLIEATSDTSPTPDEILHEADKSDFF